MSGQRRQPSPGSAVAAAVSVVEAVARVSTRVASSGVTSRTHGRVVRAVREAMAAEVVLVVPASERLVVEPVGDRGRWVRLEMTWRVYGPRGVSEFLELVNRGEWFTSKPDEMVLASARSVAEADVLCRLFKIPPGEHLVDSEDDVPANRERDRALRPEPAERELVDVDEAWQLIAAACGGDREIVEEVIGDRLEFPRVVVEALVKRAAKLVEGPGDAP